MVDIRQLALIATTLIVAIGTGYSVLFSTYLDTSDPFVANLAHPLSSATYWANKSNWVNVYFIKFAWGWTSLAFGLLWFTSPYHARSWTRLGKWVMATLTWMTFTSWFFGPAVLQRVVALTGGECVLHMPDGQHAVLPNELCFSKSTVSPSDYPELFVSTLLPSDWVGVPRLRRGHDVSGHIFLLTMSILFLVDQLLPSLREARWSTGHTAAVLGNVMLLGLWFFASCTTSLYFHSPQEKITGYILGVASYALTQVLFQ